MRVVLASPEAVPFSKTGGLADVVPALAKALSRRGHDVWMIVPHHRRAGNVPPALEPTGESVSVPISNRTVTGDVLRCELPGSGVSCLLIDQRDYFDRDGLYQNPATGDDFRDNCERFVFFSRAVLETARQLKLQPDVIHANDWQTGLVPALLSIEERDRPPFEQTASVFTIHNMAFQGQFWHWDMLLTGLDWKYFNWQQMESWNRLNLLKTGLVFSDMITTVSPTYAKEIQTSEYGAGLDAVLRHHSERLVGIVNGVDTDVWNPETDPALPVNYSVETVLEGKADCKAALQREMGLPVRKNVPLFGMISRMTPQKGFDLLSECADELLRGDIQLAFLGTGEKKYEQFCTELSSRYPERVAAVIDFDEELAHRIEGGADVYLMPSQFEPCGLNQMYSLRYGAVPVVRAVGGLADSVVDTTPETLAAQTATGFQFKDYTPEALTKRVARAAETFHDRTTWKQLAQTGMREDVSWNRSAAEYEDVYQRARSRKTQQGGADRTG